MNKEALLEMLYLSLEDLNTQIKVVAKNIDSYRSPWGDKAIPTIYQARLSDGSYVMVPLLLAKAELLSAIAKLS